VRISGRQEGLLYGRCCSSRLQPYWLDVGEVGGRGRG